MSFYQSAIHSVNSIDSQETGVTLSIVSKENLIDLVCYSDGQELDLNSQLLPPEVRSLRFSRNSKEHFESKLVYILDKYSENFSLQCELNGKTYEVEWDADDKITAQIKFEWTDGGIKTQLKVDPDQDPEQVYLILGDKLCLNPVDNCLTRCDIQTVDGVSHDSLQAHYSFHEFNLLGLILSKEIKKCFTDTLNESNEVDIVKQVYIEVDPENSSECVLSYREQAHGQQFDGTKPIFEAMNSIQYLYEPLNKSGRKSQIKRAVMMLLNATTREARDTVIAQMIKEPLFTTSTMKQVAKRYLIEVFDRVASKKTTQVIATQHGFQLLHCEPAQSGQGLGIPALLFDTKLDSIYSSQSIRIPTPILSKNLPVLLGLYKKNNIESYFGIKNQCQRLR